jgi:hypothetical protein
MKKSIGLLLVVLLAVLAIPFAAHASPMSNWRAEYYDNPSLSGQPRISRVDANVNHNWGNGSPALDIPRDNFSARWTTIRHFEKGSYLFVLSVDDGARVWLDGKLIIDAWDIGRKEKVQAKIRIETTGNHEVQVAYFESAGAASIQLDIFQLGGEKDIVGAWVGDYFSNRNLQGSPVVTRQDGAIAFNWGFESPAAKVPRDNFSVRWTRSIYLKEGKYHFRVQHDDGMRIYIDGKIIYDSWFDQPVGYKTAVAPIKEGFRTFTVEFYDHVGDAVAQLQIEEDPGNYQDSDVSDGAGAIVTVEGSNFGWSGPNRFMGRPGFSGGNFYYTNNVNGAPTNRGRWNSPISNPGNYEVFAYIPSNNATSKNAQYRIYHFGRFIDRRLDQSRYNGEFASLGIYYFDGGQSEEFITLHNSTGEANGSTRVAFDAIKFVKR